MLNLPGIASADTPEPNEEPRKQLAEFLNATDAKYAKPMQTVDLRETQDPLNLIYSVELEKARPSTLVVDEISEKQITRGNRFEPKKQPKPNDSTGTRNKIDAELLALLKDKGEAHRDRVMISFASQVRVPRFPEPAANEPRKGKANQQAMERTQALIRDLQEQRSKFYNPRYEMLKKYEIEVLQEFWLIDAMLVDMPLGALKALAKRPDTVFFGLNQTQYLPPAPDGNSNNDVQDGRAIIRSDPYFNLGLNGGYIGLLDTGVRDTHEVFSSPDNLDFLRDCIDGGANCRTGAITTTDIWPHGTSSAAIISGGSGVSAPHRGVTDITLDSFRVYPARGAGGSTRSASVNAFQQALAVLDRVIVGELQLGGDHWSDVSLAADAAFDAGAVVVSANGNVSNGPANIASPGNAHRGIGTGRTDLGSNVPSNDQIDGPTGDGRIKPDVQAPSVTETARGSGDSSYRTFSGTSGATPYAAGAAALLRNWLRRTSFSIDPGQVYAQLILSGQLTGPMDNNNGAGMLGLPVNGRASWGKTTVSKGDVIRIPVNVNGNNNVVVDAALWWPEGHEGPVLGNNAMIAGMFDNFHSDIDLRIIDPNGTLRGVSQNVNSVFERARATGTIQTGQWFIEIRGFDTWASNRPVYWATHVSRTR
ncbi:S8 family serine peptidase [Arenicella xantha]|nr:S8 family serine peptidase [Arenicella xantha]